MFKLKFYHGYQCSHFLLFFLLYFILLHILTVCDSEIILLETYSCDSKRQ